MTSTQQLLEGAASLDLALSHADAERLLALLDALDEWNARLNLTAIRARPQQLTKHLLDSLSVHAFLHGGTIVDVGTGAGFPGLPLAFVNPERHFTLLDATAKKLAFVEHAVRLLALTNVELVHARAEDWRPARRFDVVLTRALGPLERIVPWCGHLVADGGRLLAMKGRFPAAELEHVPSGWKLAAAHRLDVPGLDEERHLVELCRARERP